MTITATAEGVKDYNATYSENNTYTYVLTNASGYSNVTQNVGTLSIKKRDVTLTSATDKKVYDSTPLTNDTVTVSGDGFVDKEGASYSVTGSQTLVGSSANTFTYTLNEGTKADNYNITKVEGTLTVTDGTGEGEEPVPDDLVVTKTADDTVYALGQKVTFNVSAINIYDQKMTIELIEIEGVTLEQAIFEDVPAGGTIETTATYVITEADILNRKFVNTVKARIEKLEKEASATVKTEDPNGHLTVIKETTSSTPEGGYKLGETLNYKITVENDGNLTITDITVPDERTGDEWTIDSLAPGEKKEFETSTTVTEEDILSGHIINEATAKGKSPDPDEPDVPVTPGKTDDDPEDPNGHLTVIKETTSTPEDEKGYAEGEVISYKITVENDGNLTITEINVIDELTGDKWPIDSLEPGATKEFETTYTVTAADAAAGEVLNVATAEGKSPDPEKPEVPVTPGEDPEPTIESKFTLIIRYWIGSRDGELINTVTRVEKAGTAYDVATPPMEGYTADTERVTGVLDKDKEYDVVYTAEEYTLTILYKYQDGTEAAETYTEVLHFGDEYSVESPTINTYYPNKQKVEGTMPARDVTVTVIYAKYPVIITIDDFKTPLGLGLGSINVGETIE